MVSSTALSLQVAAQPGDADETGTAVSAGHRSRHRHHSHKRRSRGHRAKKWFVKWVLLPFARSSEKGKGTRLQRAAEGARGLVSVAGSSCCALGQVLLWSRDADDWCRFGACKDADVFRKGTYAFFLFVVSAVNLAMFFKRKYEFSWLSAGLLFQTIDANFCEFSAVLSETGNGSSSNATASSTPPVIRMFTEPIAVAYILAMLGCAVSFVAFPTDYPRRPCGSQEKQKLCVALGIVLAGVGTGVWAASNTCGDGNNLGANAGAKLVRCMALGAWYAVSAAARFTPGLELSFMFAALLIFEYPPAGEVCAGGGELCKVLSVVLWCDLIAIALLHVVFDTIWQRTFVNRTAYNESYYRERNGGTRIRTDFVASSRAAATLDADDGEGGGYATEHSLPTPEETTALAPRAAHRRTRGSADPAVTRWKRRRRKISLMTLGTEAGPSAKTKARETEVDAAAAPVAHPYKTHDILLLEGMVKGVQRPRGVAESARGSSHRGVTKKTRSASMLTKRSRANSRAAAVGPVSPGLSDASAFCSASSSSSLPTSYSTTSPSSSSSSSHTSSSGASGDSSSHGAFCGTEHSLSGYSNAGESRSGGCSIGGSLALPWIAFKQELFRGVRRRRARRQKIGRLLLLVVCTAVAAWGLALVVHDRVGPLAEPPVSAPVSSSPAAHGVAPQERASALWDACGLFTAAVIMLLVEFFTHPGGAILSCCITYDVFSRCAQWRFADESEEWTTSGSRAGYVLLFVSVFVSYVVSLPTEWDSQLVMERLEGHIKTLTLSAICILCGVVYLWSEGHYEASMAFSAAILLISVTRGFVHGFRWVYFVAILQLHRMTPFTATPPSAGAPPYEGSSKLVLLLVCMLSQVSVIYLHLNKFGQAAFDDVRLFREEAADSDEDCVSSETLPSITIQIN